MSTIHVTRFTFYCTVIWWP